MREASDRGYDCLIVRDACGSSVAALHDAAIDTAGTEGGIFGAIVNTAAELATEVLSNVSSQNS